MQAHGYEAIRHIYYEKQRGGDGKVHTIAVEWYEYLPVIGTGEIYMDEDTNDDAALTPTERRSHIADRLCDVGGSGVYRRHIASHL